MRVVGSSSRGEWRHTPGPGADTKRRPACCIRPSISFRFWMSHHHGRMSPSLGVMHRMLL